MVFEVEEWPQDFHHWSDGRRECYGNMRNEWYDSRTFETNVQVITSGYVARGTEADDTDKVAVGVPVSSPKNKEENIQV